MKESDRQRKKRDEGLRIFSKPDFIEEKDVIFKRVVCVCVCVCVCVNGGGFGNVLGPLVQMLSHSSVEYSGAASRDRQDGRRYSKENTEEGATQGEGRAWSEQRPVFFSFFRGHSRHH